MSGSLDIKREFGETRVGSTVAVAQANVELVPAIADHRIVVDKLIFSAAVAGDMNLESNATNLTPTFFGVTSVALDEPRIQTVKGEALKWTTTHAGNHSVYILYHPEP